MLTAPVPCQVDPCPGEDQGHCPCNRYKPVIPASVVAMRGMFMVKLEVVRCQRGQGRKVQTVQKEVCINGQGRLGAIRDVLRAEKIRFEEPDSQPGARQIFWLIYHAGVHYLVNANTMRDAIQCITNKLGVMVLWPTQYYRVQFKKIPLHE